MPKTAVSIVVIILASITPCFGQATETFSRYFSNLPTAVTPLTTEPSIVLQGGLAKQVSASQFGFGFVGTATANQIPFYGSSGKTLVGTSSIPLGFDLTGGEATHDQQPNGWAPVWNRIGVVIDPTVTNCGSQNSAQERGMLYEGNPQILTGSTNVFKMWYNTGLSTGTTSYAESADGVNWTCYSGNPIITGTGSGVAHGHSMVHTGGIYYWYPINLNTGAVDLYTSTNGISFTLAHANVVVPSGGGSEGTFLYNPFVWIDTPGNWKMIYSGSNVVNFQCNLATSLDGITWTKSGSNPIINDGIVACGAYVQKIGSTYYMWTQGESDSSTNPITDIFLYTSSNLTSWTRSGDCVFCRSTKDEGFSSLNGQTSDPTLLQVGNQTFLYYLATPDQNTFKIKAAVANMPISQVVTTKQGLFPVIDTGYGQPFSIGLGPNGEKINLQYQTSSSTGGWGTIGFNAHYNSVTSIVPDNTGSTGWFERVINSTTNAGFAYSDFIVDNAGNVRSAFGLDFLSDGTGVKDYYFPTANGASSHPKLCFGTEIGTCTTYMAFWIPGGLIFNGGTGLIDLGGYRLTEIADPSLGGVGEAEIWDDSTNHRPQFNFNGGNTLQIPGFVASGTLVLSTTQISSGLCSSVQSTVATNAAATDLVVWNDNADPSTNGLLTIRAYPTSGNVNFRVCNPTAVAITPNSETLTWSIMR